MAEKLLLLVSLALSAGSSLVYALHRDLRHAISWAAAAVITGAVTL